MHHRPFSIAFFAAHEFLSVAPLPGRENGTTDSCASGVDQIRHRVAFGADDRLVHALTAMSINFGSTPAIRSKS
jgi:hypothetical protein